MKLHLFGTALALALTSIACSGVTIRVPVTQLMDKTYCAR